MPEPRSALPDGLASVGRRLASDGRRLVSDGRRLASDGRRFSSVAVDHFRRSTIAMALGMIALEELPKPTILI